MILNRYPRVVATALAAVVAIVAVSGGCGGSEDDNAQSKAGAAQPVKPETGLPLRPSRYSSAEFIRRANKLCRESYAAMFKEFRYREKHRPPMSDSRVFARESSNNFLPHMQFWFDDITWLGAPDGKKTEAEQMLEALQLAVYAGQDRRIEDAAELVAIFASYTMLAREYGLDDCLVEERAFAPIV
jgi:hypothetical protein